MAFLAAHTYFQFWTVLEELGKICSFYGHTAQPNFRTNGTETGNTCTLSAHWFLYTPTQLTSVNSNMGGALSKQPTFKHVPAQNCYQQNDCFNKTVSSAKFSQSMGWSVQPTKCYTSCTAISLSTRFHSHLTLTAHWGKGETATMGFFYVNMLLYYQEHWFSFLYTGGLLFRRTGVQRLTNHNAQFNQKPCWWSSYVKGIKREPKEIWQNCK